MIQNLNDPLDTDIIKQKLPMVRLEELWEFEKQRNGLRTNGATGKYVINIDLYLKEKIDCFRAMGLLDSNKKQVLDIGTGVGYFPWLCEHFGHTCDYTNPAPIKFYKLAWQVLALKSAFFEWSVISNKKFALPKKYDIITSHRTVFDIFDYHWHVEDWKYFLQNCQEYLSDNGFVFIKTNLVKGNLYYTPHPAVIEFFAPYILPNFDALTFRINKLQIQEMLHDRPTI